MAFIDDRVVEGLRLREFDIDRGDRLVTGVLWTAPGARGDAPIVCLGHGASGDRFQPPIPRLARRFVADHGFAALAIDGPVHGRRQIGPGGRDAFWPEWDRERSPEDMTADWIAALDFAQIQPDIGAGPVGYWGLSMGTVYGVPFVAAEPRVVCAVLGLMGVSGPVHYRPKVRSSANAIRCPLLFIVQLDDELFARTECLALFDAFGSTDKCMHAHAGTHGEVPAYELDQAVDHLVHHLTGQPPDRRGAFTSG